MEATNRNSKKRKQHPSSSNPYIGMFTRSKSQINIHRHRSGRVFSNSISGGNENDKSRCLISSAPVKRASKSISSDSSFNQDCVTSRTVVDLRSRRVFSPASVNVNAQHTAKAESFDLCLGRKDKILSDSCSILKELEKVGEIDSVSEDTDPSDKTCAANSSDKRGRDSDGVILEQIHEDSGEECVQATPPDSDVFVVADDQVSKEVFQGKPLDRGVSKDGQTNMNQRNHSTYKTKMVLNPCSRLKVFKTPNSFSYRRLLPYLVDISKNNSFASSNGQSLKLGLKVTPSVSNRFESNVITQNQDIDKASLDDGVAHREANISSGLPDLSVKHGTDNRETESVIAISNRTDEDFGQECVQRTPPDSDVDVLEAEVNGKVKKSVKEVSLMSTNEGTGSCLTKGIPANMTQRNTFRSEVVLKPCSQKKVIFKTPNSFSYKRLLPYLTEITKDDSCATKNAQLPILESSLEVRQAIQVLDSHNQEVSIDKSAMGISISEPRCIEYGDLPIVELNSGNPISKSSNQTIEGYLLKAELDSLDNPAKLEDAHDNSSLVGGSEASVIALSSLGIVEPLQGKCIDFPDNAKEGSKIPGLKFTSEEAPLNNRLTHLETSMSSGFPDLSAKDGNHNKQKGSVGAISDQNEDDFGGQSVLITPPNSDIVEAEVNGGSGAEHGSLMALNKRGCVSEPISANMNQMSTFTFSSKVVSKPSSRKKVFKNPNSFSYKRLLPYLMKIAKDDSFDSRNGQSPKLDNDSVDKQTVERLDSHSQGILIENIETHNADCGSLSSVTLNLDSSNVTSSERSTTGECLLNPKLDLSDKPREMDVAHNNSSLYQGSDPQITTLCSYDSVEKDSEFSKLNVTAETASLDQRLSHLETKTSSGLPDVRGILKRCPLGCRGVCTCLNCASFRLNAERAFEFSRNQLQDAEEVALDLMKELTCIRTMLENFTEACNDQAVVQINQAKEACTSAFKAEELAKARLNQMSYDLNCHCKMGCLQRPRVRFAHNDERIDSKDDTCST